MRRRSIARVRERMVLGQVHPLLEAGERVSVWAHVHAPAGGQPGLLSLTAHRCLVHWSAAEDASAILRWDEVTRWDLSVRDHGSTVLTLAAGSEQIAVRLALTTGTRARNTAEVVGHVARHAPADVPAGGSGSTQHLGAEPRGWRGHARRIGVTVVGLLVVLVSALFASPFVPGPGALTFLAGLAILATEYDWARDVHHWTKRMFDRLLARWRTRRARRRAARAEVRSLEEARDRAALRKGPRTTRESDVEGPADAQAT